MEKCFCNNYNFSTVNLKFKSGNLVTSRVNIHNRKFYDAGAKCKYTWWVQIVLFQKISNGQLEQTGSKPLQLSLFELSKKIKAPFTAHSAPLWHRYIHRPLRPRVLEHLNSQTPRSANFNSIKSFLPKVTHISKTHNFQLSYCEVNLFKHGL